METISENIEETQKNVLKQKNLLVNRKHIKYILIDQAHISTQNHILMKLKILMENI